MAEEQTIVVRQEKKPSFWQRIKGAINRSERSQEAWNRMHKVAGFQSIYDIDDVEARRGELRLVLNEIQEEYDTIFDPQKMEELTPEKVRNFKTWCNNRVFSLFFSVGSAWYRGLDDRELAKKVKAYLFLWNRVGDHASFVDDVFMCSMQLINLSWKALDVTNQPPLVFETKTVVQPEKTRIDLRDAVEKV